MLNQRDRFIKTFLFKETDRKIRYETLGFWPETINRWKNAGLPSYITMENIFEYFEMDQPQYVKIETGVTSPYYPLFEVVKVEEDTETFIIVDKDGIKKKQLKKDKYLSMPQFLDFPVKDKIDYEKVRSRLAHDTEGRVGMTLKELKEIYKHRDYPLGITICGGFAHPRELMGLEDYLIALYEKPELINLIMRDWLKLYLSFTTDIIKTIDIDFVMIWEDMAYKNGPLISPELYDVFIYPYMKRLIDNIKENGVKIIILDSDGDIHKLIPLFIECGVNVLLPFEVQAGMDIRKIRDMYPELGILGGLDKRILTQNIGCMEDEISSKVPYMYERGRYIAGIDHSVPPDVSLNNFKIYLKIIRNLR